MDLMDIARRTGIEPRRLRYAVYRALIPGVRQVDVRRGSVRRFTGFEAFGVALAATLLDAGLRREVVADCIRTLSVGPGRGATVSRVPLYRSFAGGGGAEVIIGDGRQFRVRAAASPGWSAMDTGWLDADGKHVASGGYEPVVLLTVAVAKLAAVLQGQ